MRFRTKKNCKYASFKRKHSLQYKSAASTTARITPKTQKVHKYESIHTFISNTATHSTQKSTLSTFTALHLSHLTKYLFVCLQLCDIYVTVLEYNVAQIPENTKALPLRKTPEQKKGGKTKQSNAKKQTEHLDSKKTPQQKQTRSFNHIARKQRG